MQWTFSLPAADNPIFEGNEGKIANGQPKHVWFLANAAPVVDRHFTVPAGTALYATILAAEWDNQICVDPDTNYSIDELRSLAKSFVDSLTDIEVQVDGVPVEGIAAYRSTSPVFASTTAEQICVASRPVHTDPMVADGYALLLAPLSVGEHTIHISGVVVVNTSYHLTTSMSTLRGTSRSRRTANKSEGSASLAAGVTRAGRPTRPRKKSWREGRLLILSIDGKRRPVGDIGDVLHSGDLGSPANYDPRRQCRRHDAWRSSPH